MRREHRRGPILKLGVFEHAFEKCNQQSGKLTLCNFGIKIDERLEPSNLKATALAADPSEGKNLLNFEKSIFQIWVKNIQDLFEKVLENPGDSFGRCGVL